MDNTLTVSATQANKPLIPLRRFRAIAVTLFLVLTALLVGCGFKPRTTVTLPAELTNINLVILPNDAGLIYQLDQAFANKGIRISDNSSTLLTIESETISQRNGAISPQGWVVEYLIDYTLTFSLSQDNKSILEPLGLSSQRSYQFGENQISGRTDEESLLVRDMRREIIQQMLRIIGQRLTTELQQPPAEPSSHETQS